MSDRTTFPIVGMYHRPPALALINVIAIGTPLLLIAEPENAYDPNAIAVWLHSRDIPEAAYGRLRDLLPDYGKTLDDILNEADWQLGYIARDFAAQLRASGAVPTDEPVIVTFAVNAQGAPRAKFAESPY